MRGRWISSLVLVTLALSSITQANGGWVIEREDKTKSPLFRKNESIANQFTQEEKEHLAIVAAYERALESYQKEVREHWPSGEVSNQERWVSYSADWKTKRVVDFENNRIEISLENQYAGRHLDFAKLSTMVREQVEDVIGATVAKGLASDPVHKAVEETFAAIGADESGTDSEKLVLAELFDSHQPNADQIRKKAVMLMKNASIRYQVLSASLASIPVKTNNKITYVIPLPDNRIRKKVKEYGPMVKQYASRFSLSDDIVMAIIHTESHFNPLARSHVPAFGLMQIVPSTAGRDATKKLYSKSKLLSARYLYDPSKNIEVGAAYLNVLYYEYLSGIENPESRLYYALAAYNAGASNVARAFVNKSSFQDALPLINSMKPEAVLKTILKKSPQRETREYVEKVLKRRNFYQRV